MLFKSQAASKQALMRPMDLVCNWCGAGVPLPPGEFSGVCIDCGTVMFRPPAKVSGGAAYLPGDLRGTSGSMMPSPA